MKTLTITTAVIALSVSLTGCFTVTQPTAEEQELQQNIVTIRDTVTVLKIDTLVIKESKIDTIYADNEESYLYAQREGRMYNYWQDMDLPCTLVSGNSYETLEYITFTKSHDVVINTTDGGFKSERVLYAMGLDDLEFYDYDKRMVRIGDRSDYGKFHQSTLYEIESCLK